MHPASRGRRIESSMRARMERQFQHDFAHVRVHIGSKAAVRTTALRARAVTSGRDIWFRTPQDARDPRILAHELAHVLQQAGRSPEGWLSPDAVPPIQLLRVIPDGQFAAALEAFTDEWHVPDAAVRLLRRSPTFRRMVRTLNRHYVYIHDPALSTAVRMGDDGVVQDGRFRNRRVIGILQGGARAFFMPFQAPENPLSYDVIYISSGTTEQFIRDIAHEAAHAVELVTGQGTTGSTIVDEVRSLIQEEQRVRGQEHAVVRELRRTRPGRRVFPSPPGAVSDVWAIERDFPRISERRTYLEHGFFGAAMRRAIAEEGLSEEQMNQIDREVDQLTITPDRAQDFIADPDNFWLNIVIPSKYGRLRYLSRVVHVSWSAFLEAHAPGSERFEALKEARLQEHAAALDQIGRQFFGETITYTPRPDAPAQPSAAEESTFWSRMLSP